MKDIKEMQSKLPAGYAIVPIQPTYKMMKSGRDELLQSDIKSDQDDVCFCWQAMIQNFMQEQSK